MIIKSVTGREIFSRHKEVKKLLRGGNLWTIGYCANTASEYADADGIQRYISSQGNYKRLFFQQLNLDL